MKNAHFGYHCTQNLVEPATGFPWLLRKSLCASFISHINCKSFSLYSPLQQDTNVHKNGTLHLVGISRLGLTPPKQANSVNKYWHLQGRAELLLPRTAKRELERMRFQYFGCCLSDESMFRCSLKLNIKSATPQLIGFSSGVTLKLPGGCILVKDQTSCRILHSAFLGISVCLLKIDS